MTADPARVATAHLLLTQLGVILADLHNSTIHRPPPPSMAEYLPRVIAAASPSSNRLYGPYWNRVAVAWGGRPLDTIAASDVEVLQRQAVATARRRRNSHGGRQAGEHIISAARVVFNRAIADGLVDRAASPAHLVPKPRRMPNVRRALTADELEQINLVARTSGNDVVLDALLLRLHTETPADAAAPSACASWTWTSTVTWRGQDRRSCATAVTLQVVDPGATQLRRSRQREPG